MSRKSQRGKRPGNFYRKPTNPPSGSQRRALYALSKTAEDRGLTDWVAKIGNPYSPDMTFKQAQDILTEWRAAFPTETKEYEARKKAISAAMRGTPTTAPSVQHGLVTFSGSGLNMEKLGVLLQEMAEESKQRLKQFAETYGELARQHNRVERVAQVLTEPIEPA